MGIGFIGEAVIILRKPIDDDEPARLYTKLVQENDVGITIHYGEGEDETTYFIPFSNIRAIEKVESETPVAPRGEQQWTQ